MEPTMAAVVTEVGLPQIVKALEQLAESYPAERISRDTLVDIDKCLDILTQRMCEYMKKESETNAATRIIPGTTISHGHTNSGREGYPLYGLKG